MMEPEESQAAKAYRQGKRRLIDRLISMKRGGAWSPSPEKKELLAFAARLTQLVNDLDGASSAMEDAQNDALDYEVTLRGMRAMAENALSAAEKLPNARKKHALPFAISCFMHLRVFNGFPIGSIYIESPSFLEFVRICELAKIFISSDSIRVEFGKQALIFDADFYPPSVFELISYQRPDPLFTDQPLPCIAEKRTAKVD